MYYFEDIAKIIKNFSGVVIVKCTENEKDLDLFEEKIKNISLSCQIIDLINHQHSPQERIDFIKSKNNQSSIKKIFIVKNIEQIQNQFFFLKSLSSNFSNTIFFIISKNLILQRKFMFGLNINLITNKERSFENFYEKKFEDDNLHRKFLHLFKCEENSEIPKELLEVSSDKIKEIIIRSIYYKFFEIFKKNHQKEKSIKYREQQIRTIRNINETKDSIYELIKYKTSKEKLIFAAIESIKNLKSLI